MGGDKSDKSVSATSAGPANAAPKQSSARGRRQLPGQAVPASALCPHPGKLVPLFFVLHFFLHFVDSLQRLQTFIEQKRRVIYQHVYIANKLLPRTETAITLDTVIQLPEARRRSRSQRQWAPARSANHVAP